MKAFLRWLFKSEREKYVKEAREILEEAKEYSNSVKGKIYVNYDRVTPGSDEFLYGMQPLFNNRYLISWLNEIKMQWQQLVKTAVDNGDDKNVRLCAVRMAMIDDLFIGLKDFEYKYEEMLEQKKEGQVGEQEQ